jgi:hypothetical protein
MNGNEKARWESTYAFAARGGVIVFGDEAVMRDPGAPGCAASR